MAPTLVDDKICSTRVKKPIDDARHPVNVALQRAVDSGALRPPAASPSMSTATSSQQSQASHPAPQMPSGSRPKQAKTVEAEKKKPQQQPRKSYNEFVMTSREDEPGRFSLRKRKPTAARVAMDSDSDNEEVSPRTMKSIKLVTKILNKEKTARPFWEEVDEILIPFIGKLLWEAAKTKTVAKLTDGILPKNKEVYIVKGGTMDTVRKMDKYSWRHNRRVPIPGIGQQIYYNGLLDAKSPVMPGLKKTIIKVEKQKSFIILYKMNETEEATDPQPSTSVIAQSEAQGQSASEELATKTQSSGQPTTK